MRCVTREVNRVRWEHALRVSPPLEGWAALCFCLVACVALPGSVAAWSQAPAAYPSQAPHPAEDLPPGITPSAKQAIDRGLAYLARTQDRQGSWSNRGGFGEYPVAMTALAGVALLMDGNTTTQGRYAPQVDRATNFLLRSTTSSGLIARGTEDARPMYGHGFAMLFLGELQGMTDDAHRAEEIQHVLAAAAQLTARAQSRLGGWIYTPDARGDEGSVTITQLQALRSARNAGVAVPKAVIDQALEYLAVSQNSDGGIRYTAGNSGASRVPITAAAVCCWYNAGDYTNPRAKQALEYCKRFMRPLAPLGGHDFYAHLYYAQALYIGRDALWDEYFAKRRDFFLSPGRQQADGSWLGDGVGDIYGTAIALIVLQLPYNYLPIMQR